MRLLYVPQLTHPLVTFVNHLVINVILSRLLRLVLSSVACLCLFLFLFLLFVALCVLHADKLKMTLIERQGETENEE